MNSIHVIIADSSLISREGLKSILNNEIDMEVVGQADCTNDLIQKAHSTPHNVIVIDYLSPTFDIKDIRSIRAMLPETRFVSIVEFPQKVMIQEALKLGVGAHLLKDCSYDEIVDSVRSVMKNEQFFCGKVLDVLNDVNGKSGEISCDPIQLSIREVEIIQKIAEGYTNKQIADTFFISTHTVMTHRKNIMNKLGVNNTAGLVVYAIKEQLISPNHFLFNA